MVNSSRLLVLAFLSVSAAFKLTPIGWSRERPTPGGSGSQEAPKVLVVGATGRIGTLVTRGLVDRGYEVVCMARDPASISARTLERLPATKVIKGDVTDLASVKEAMEGCQACIMCSGAARVSRLSDLWKPRFSKAYPKSHPYYVNFLGTQNVIKAAQLAGTRKVVRITGLSVGYSPFNVIAVLLNVVLSMAVKWQLRSEMALRSSGLDYTVFRPGGLTDHGARPQEVMLASDGQPLPVASISRQDVANLCIGALEVEEASCATFSCVTRKEGKRRDGKGEGELRVRGGGQEGGVEGSRRLNTDPLLPYKALIKRSGAPDVSVLSPKAHSLATALFLLASSSALATLGVALWSLACMGVARLGGARRVLGSTIVAMVAARGGGSVPMGMDQQEFVSRAANGGVCQQGRF